MSVEDRAKIMRKLLKLQISRQHISLCDLAERAYYIAQQIGETAEDVWQIALPLFEETFAEQINPENVAKVFKDMRDNKHEHRGGH